MPDKNKEWAALDNAAKSIKDGGQSAENRYGAIYQRLVRLGLAPQLRRKYR